MVQTISISDVKAESKINSSKPESTTNTDFLELLLKDIKDNDKSDKDLPEDDDKKDNLSDDKDKLELKDLFKFDNKDSKNILQIDTNITDNPLKENNIKEVKNILESQFKQQNILLSKADEKEFKQIDNLKDLMKFADKKGLNVEKLKFDIADKFDIKQIKLNDKLPKIPTSNKFTSQQTINIQKETSNVENKVKKNQISLENILNSTTKNNSLDKTEIPKFKESKLDTKTEIFISQNNMKISKLDKKEINIQENKQHITSIKKEIKPNIDLESLLNPKSEKTDKLKIIEKKSNDNVLNLNNTQTNLVNDVKAKSIQAKETIKNFNQNLDEAIKNYKPPVSKINIELNPQNLGKVEVTIVQRGNNIQVHMNTDQNNIQMFQNNQAEFRQALSSIGFSNIDMSFNSNQDRERKQNQAKRSYTENEAIDNIEMGEMEIKANYQYA